VELESRFKMSQLCISQTFSNSDVYSIIISYQQKCDELKEELCHLDRNVTFLTLPVEYDSWENTVHRQTPPLASCCSTSSFSLDNVLYVIPTLPNVLGLKLIKRHNGHPILFIVLEKNQLQCIKMWDFYCRNSRGVRTVWNA
jgi:hypothetical protein